MNERDFQGFKVGYESTIVAGSHSTVDDCRQAREAYLKADIARQLTRIADQGTIRPETFKHWLDRKAQADSDFHPAPDVPATPESVDGALVEAVVKTATSLLVALGLNPSEGETDREYKQRIVDDYGELGLANVGQFRKALDAHKKGEPHPVNDALVEAVKIIANSQLTLGALKEYAKNKGIEVDETDTFMSIDRKIAFDALDAHKKAVT